MAKGSPRASGKGGQGVYIILEMDDMLKISLVSTILNLRLSQR